MIHSSLKTVAITVILSLAASGASKLPKDLENLPPTKTVDVIIQFKAAPTEKLHQKVRDKGGSHKADLDMVKGALYSLPAEAIRQLADDPDVAYISPDRPVQGLLDYATSTVGADIASRYGWEGAGIGVAVIDSGINDVWDLKAGASKSKSRIVYSESFLTTKKTDDELGHGTHVAGILAGNANYSANVANTTRAFRGIAPQANLINLRVLDQNGAGTDSAVIAAIQRAIALKSQYNIRVINLSLGHPVFESYAQDPLCQAVEQAWKAGIVVVVAAGNSGRNNSVGTDGYATINSPGNDPYVITVGAMKTNGTASRGDDTIASYSSKGPTLIDHVVKPDIVAPGNRVISLLAANSIRKSQSSVNLIQYSYYQNTKSAATSGDYYRLSGTSMATPMVSGAAALMLQKDPSLTPDMLKARLMKTAAKSFPSYSIATDPLTGQTYTSQYDIFTVGAGYLDIWAALNNSDRLPMGAALSPSVRYDAATRQVYLVAGTSAIWGTTAVWGTSAIWGTTAVWGTGAVWGSGAIWGSTAVWGTGTTSVNSLTSVSTPESTKIALYGEN